jgi:hypothetical protein
LCQPFSPEPAQHPEHMLMFLTEILSPELLISAVLTVVLLSILGYVRLLSFQFRSVLSELQQLSKMNEHLSESNELLRQHYSKTQWIGDKVSFMELKVSRMLSSSADAVRSLADRLSKFDSLRGKLSVVSHWVVLERDDWLRRHSATSWWVVAEATQLHLISQAVYQRLSSYSKGWSLSAEELCRGENKITQLIDVLRFLRSHMANTQWRVLSTLAPKITEPPTHLPIIEFPVYEHMVELGKHYSDLSEMAADWGVSWADATRGLSIDEIYGPVSVPPPFVEVSREGSEPWGR